jgi:IMP dehydrogenase/GMP reductase
MIKEKNLGADFVMLGGMFAGHDESGTGEIIERNGRKYKLFYGMSSKTAMDKHVTIFLRIFISYRGWF